MTDLIRDRLRADKCVQFVDENIEAWKVEHRIAMEAFDYRDIIKELVFWFEILEKVDKEYCHDVINDSAKFNYEIDNWLKQSYSLWIDRAKTIWNHCWRLNSDGYPVENLQSLRNCLQIAKTRRVVDFEHNALEVIRSHKPSLDRLRKVCRNDSSWDAH